MPRKVLPESKIHSAIREKVASHQADIVGEVERATENHRVVVVGMAQNPHVKRARKMLDEKGISFEYLEYGSYLNTWRRRTALKLWTGWPTFPMVFVDGSLVGGADETAKLLANGELTKQLGRARA